MLDDWGVRHLSTLDGWAAVSSGGFHSHQVRITGSASTDQLQLVILGVHLVYTSFNTHPPALECPHRGYALGLDIDCWTAMARAEFLTPPVAIALPVTF